MTIFYKLPVDKDDPDIQTRGLYHVLNRITNKYPKVRWHNDKKPLDHIDEVDQMFTIIIYHKSRRQLDACNEGCYLIKNATDPSCVFQQYQLNEFLEAMGSGDTTRSDTTLEVVQSQPKSQHMWNATCANCNGNAYQSPFSFECQNGCTDSLAKGVK